MKVAAEDSYIITLIRTCVVRRGERDNVKSAHLVTEDDVLVDRYCILKGCGYIMHHPASLYRGTGVSVPKTRAYKQEIDNTYFKYYDDAEEVLKNLILFIKWLKAKVKDSTPRKVKAMGINQDLLKDRLVTPGWEKLSKTSFEKKKRGDLKSLARDLADERDLV